MSSRAPGARVVPVARRQLLAEPAKLAVALAAVAAAVALVLRLSRLRRGMGEQVTTYLEHQPPVLVGRSGSRDVLSQTSALPEALAARGAGETRVDAVRDPNCGMLVDPAQAFPLELEDQRLFFCAAGCREEYAERAITIPPWGMLPGENDQERRSR